MIAKSPWVWIWWLQINFRKWVHTQILESAKSENWLYFIPAGVGQDVWRGIWWLHISLSWASASRVWPPQAFLHWDRFSHFRWDQSVKGAKIDGMPPTQWDQTLVKSLTLKSGPLLHRNFGKFQNDYSSPPSFRDKRESVWDLHLEMKDSWRRRPWKSGDLGDG